MKRVAIWLYGGIGTGNFSQGQPVLERLVKELTKDFHITVYTVAVINIGYSATEFELVSPPDTISNLTIRWLILCRYFVRDHFKKKYNMICAFWGFPGGFFATVLSKLLRVPIIINLQGGDSVGIPELNYGVMHRPLFRMLAGWAYRKANVLTTLTAFQRDQVGRYGIKRHIQIVPMGADCQIFKWKDQWNPSMPLKFLHVSNYNPIKDIDTTLNTFSLVAQKKNCILRIVGGEYEKSDARILTQSLGISELVEWAGPMPYADMRAQFEWADILIHTSVYEGQAIVVAEAALMGLLITGTNVGLLADLGSRAVVAPPRDAHGLADKIIDVIDHPDECKRKRDASHQWALEHDFAWTVATYKKIIYELA